MKAFLNKINQFFINICTTLKINICHSVAFLKKSVPFITFLSGSFLLSGCDTSIKEMVAGKTASKVEAEGWKSFLDNAGSFLGILGLIGGILLFIFLWNYIKDYSRRKREQERDERMDKMMERQQQAAINNNNINAPKF